MLRRRELEWFYQQGASFLYPDEWERYLAPIPLVERWDLMSAYNRILTDDSNPTQMLIAAKAWSRWELATSRLFTEQEAIKKAEEDDKFVIAFARIENHYFVHGGFLQHDNQLLRDADKIAHIPTVIVHGRYDLVCPFENAWDLKKRLPQADLFIVPNAGHSLKEDGIRHELIEAADRFADL
jgi:proline iminopeptidase